MDYKIAGLSIRWTIFWSFAIVIGMILVSNLTMQGFLATNLNETENVRSALDESQRISVFEKDLNELRDAYVELRSRSREASSLLASGSAVLRLEYFKPIADGKGDKESLAKVVSDILAKLPDLEASAKTIPDFRKADSEIQSYLDEMERRLSAYQRELVVILDREQNFSQSPETGFAEPSGAYQYPLKSEYADASGELLKQLMEAEGETLDSEPEVGDAASEAERRVAIEAYEKKRRNDIETFLNDYTRSDIAGDLKEIAGRLLLISKNIERTWTEMDESPKVGTLKYELAGDAPLSQVFSAAQSEVAETRKAKIEPLNEALEGQESAAKAPIWVAWILLIFTIVASVLLSWWTSVRINQPLRQLAGIANDVTHGNLAIDVDSDRRDEIGELARAFDAMISEMNEVIRQAQLVAERVVESASVVTESAGGVMAQMDHQANGIANATRDVADVQERSGTIEGHASAAAEASDEVQEHSTNGQRVVTQTKHEMATIADSVNQSAEIINSLGKASDQIGDIVSTISEIADQTNLLALNAAIEAARAGEHGRGFAVVADEVRKLAETTGRSADEIISMIDKFRRETARAVRAMKEGADVVERGVNYAESAGESLGTILHAVQRVTGLMGQTTDATRSQVQASSSVSITLNELTDLSVIARDAAHKTSQEAEQMQAAAHRLQSLLRQFVLHDQKSQAGLSRIVRKADLGNWS